MGCSVDPAAWARENRFTLANGRRYVAELAVAESLGLDAPSLRRDAERLLERWCPGAEVDAATFAKPAVIGKTTARRERLPGVLPMVEGKAQTAWVSFSYHGSPGQSYPWLVWAGSPLTAPGEICPTEGEWLLLQLKDVGEAREPEKSLPERLAEAGDEAKAGLKDAVKTLVVVAVVGAVGYYLITSRMRQRAAVAA
jgi:hypothetical protein